MTRDDAQLTPASYLRRLRQEGKRLPSDERSELITGMQAHVADLESQALAPDVLAARLAALGDPKRIVDDYLAMTVLAKPYRTKIVIAALSCAWVVALSGLAYLWLDSFFSMGISGPMIILGISGAIRSVGALALLVTTIVGSMWRRWLDGVSALLLIVSANTAPVLVALSLSSGPAPIIGRLFLGLTVIVLVICTAHWARRLGKQHDRPRTTRFALLGAAAAITVATLAVVLSHSAGLTASAGQLTVVNDTGATATITYCPQQNCSTAKGIIMNNGDHRSFAATDGNMPDSVVVKQQGQPTKCALDMGGIGLPGENAGQVIYLSRDADTQTCGADVESLNGGPAPGSFPMSGIPPGHSATATPVGTSIIYLSMLTGPGCMSGAAGEFTLNGRAAGDPCGAGAVFDQFGAVVGQDTSAPTSDTRVTAKLHATHASGTIPAGWSTWILTMRHTPDGWRIAAIARRL